jgi:thiol-disulfide isomerase/thioredoxin
VNLPETRLVGLDGGDCHLGEDQFAGKVIVIDIFGTWCPNCHDATDFLSELYTRYHDQGLSVVGIGFEFSKDLARNLQKVHDYVENRQVPYPMTLAFRDEIRSPTEVFPTIQGKYAFPTIVFLYGDGRVKTVHSGFTSSASREDHLVLRSKFERLIQDMLSEEG